MKILIVLSFALVSFGASAASTSEKAVLQAAMQRHVESQLIDGAVLNVDLETGAIQKLYPTKAHPMILTMGENFVLCVTLSDTDGNKLLADYYIAPQGDGFVVLRTEINNRDALKKLMKAGIVATLQ